MITILQRGGGVSWDPQKCLHNMCTTPYNEGFKKLWLCPSQGVKEALASPILALRTQSAGYSPNKCSFLFAEQYNFSCLEDIFPTEEMHFCKIFLLFKHSSNNVLLAIKEFS